MERVRIKRTGLADVPEMEDDSTVEFITSGSTGLNLALSGKGHAGGWARGRVVNIVGDGSSGKTLLLIETIAYAIRQMKNVESKIYPQVTDIIIRYNNAEVVMDFNLKTWRIHRDLISWTSSHTIQEFGRDFGRTVDEMKKGQMLIYALDSLDGVSSEEEVGRFEESQKSDKAIVGSMNMEKQKYFHQFFRSMILPKMENKDVTLFIISQTRKKIGMTFGEKQYRTGGDALNFFTHQVVWLSEIKKIIKTIQGQDIFVGIRVRAKVKRNKVFKPFREAEFIILFDYGIDDVGSNIDFLFNLDGKKTGNNLSWDKKNFRSRDVLIEYIEVHDQKFELIEAVEKKWKTIEDEASALRNRKAKF